MNKGKFIDEIKIGDSAQISNTITQMVINDFNKGLPIQIFDRVRKFHLSDFRELSSTTSSCLTSPLHSCPFIPPRTSIQSSHLRSLDSLTFNACGKRPGLSLSFQARAQVRIFWRQSLVDFLT